MANTKHWWTVAAVYDDTDEPYTDYIEAATWQEAKTKALREAEAPIRIAGIFAGKLTAADAEGEHIIPIRGRGHVVSVNQIVVAPMDVRIPLRCPECRADLKKAHALIEVGLRYQYWHGHITHDGKAWAHERDDRRTEGDLVPAVALRCKKCNHFLWNGAVDD